MCGPLTLHPMKEIRVIVAENTGRCVTDCG